eukprot:2140929-Pyramimonas_sp.AAC.1
MRQVQGSLNTWAAELPVRTCQPPTRSNLERWRYRALKGRPPGFDGVVIEASVDLKALEEPSPSQAQHNEGVVDP